MFFGPNVLVWCKICSWLDPTLLADATTPDLYIAPPTAETHCQLPSLLVHQHRERNGRSFPFGSYYFPLVRTAESFIIILFVRPRLTYILYLPTVCIKLMQVGGWVGGSSSLTLRYAI